MIPWDSVWTVLDSTFLQSVAVIGSIYLAYRGLYSWRDQHVWTRNAELTEELLVAVRGYESAMKKVRRPFSSLGEGESRDRNTDETPERKKHLDMLFIPFERIDKENDVMVRLQNADSRSRVRFGKEVSSALDEILEAHKEFMVAAQMRFMRGRDMYEAPQSPDVREANRKYEAAVWAGLEEPDRFEVRIDAAILKIERVLGEYMGKQKG